jgi:hypothetical protein
MVRRKGAIQAHGIYIVSLPLIEDIISDARLGTYLRATGFDRCKALDLYGWNIQVSEAFYPILSASEVSLRNIVAARIEDVFGPQWWDEDEYLKRLGRGKGIVKRARDKRMKNKGHVTAGCMTSELNFGFWAKMLLPKYEELFWTPVGLSFPKSPAGTDREMLWQKCDDICDLRNRIFHHEPIFDRDISGDYHNCLELVRWISPVKADWIKKYSRVATVMRQKP